MARNMTIAKQKFGMTKSGCIGGTVPKKNVAGGFVARIVIISHAMELHLMPGSEDTCW